MKTPLTQKDITWYAAEHGFSAAYCIAPLPEDHAPDHIKTLVLLIRPYAPGGRLMDHFYPASNAAYHDARRMAEHFQSELGIKALPLGFLKIKPICGRHPSFGRGMNTLNYLPGIGSRFCVELLGLEIPVETAPAAPYPREALPCASCGLCAKACPTGAITADGFQKERCIRYHMMSGKPMPEEMRPMIGSEAGTRGILGCDICQRVCPANKKAEEHRTPEDDCVLEELLTCDEQTLRRFAALYGRNYANRSRILAQAVLAAANWGRADCLDSVEALRHSGSETVARHADWAAEKLRKR